MRYLTHFIIFSLFISIFAVSGCSTGQRAFSRGAQLEADGNFEDAMYSYAEAFRKDPDAGEYRASFFKARDKASEKRFKMGEDQFDRGDYVGALAEFQTAYGLDPTQGRFKQRADETVRFRDAQLAFQEGLDFEKANKLKEANRAYAAALELHPENKEYKAALVRISGQRKSKLEGFELSLKSNKPITLKFKDAKIKDVFTIITQLTGINFIFDEGVKDQTISIYLENATFQQALDLLTNMNKLHTKVLNESTVLIFSKTPEKSKQYDDLTLRTIHLSYMEAKKAINLIRTMIQVKKIYVNEESNSIIVRDTSDIVDVIERILEANDVPDPEVILEVEVIEVSDTNAKTVGLLLKPYSVDIGGYNNGQLFANVISQATTAATATAINPVTGLPLPGTNTSATAITNLLQAFSKGPYAAFTTVPNATYNFGKTLSDGEVLSNPKIRVKNKEKAKFNVGTRIPIVTTTLNGTVSQANVQYVDVGVKLNAEPTIQLNNEIMIKLSLEVSQQIGGVQTVSGASVVTIGTRNLDTVLSLKDGETSIIGGLREYRTSNSKNQIYLLGDIPVIGPLLSNYDTSKGKTELILAITPRLVRSVTVPQANLMSFVTGKEDDPSLVKPMASFDQESVFETGSKTGAAIKGDAGRQTAGKPTVAKPGPAEIPTALQPSAKPVNKAVPRITVQPPANTVKPLSAEESDEDAEDSEADESTAESAAPPSKPVPPVTQPSPASTVPAAPVTGTPQPAEVLPAAAKPEPVPVKRGLLQIAAPATIGIGQTFWADIKAGDAQNLNAATFVLTYNPALVSFMKSTEGKLLGQDGKPTLFSATPDAAAGTLTIKQERTANSGGISGNGTLVSVLFSAKSKGAASFGFSSVSFTGADGTQREMLPFSSTVTIQ